MLQQRDGHYEIVANGVFLMDTRAGGSERLLVNTTASRMPHPGRMLIGGLGVGFSLAAALVHPGVSEVHVVEREPAVLRWNRGPLAPWNADALADPRVRTYEADVADWLANAPASCLDTICLDVARMSEHFAEVETTEVATARGEPDVILQGRLPLRHGVP